MVALQSEFTVEDQIPSDRRGPVRWILSHQLRHKGYLAGFLGGSLAMVILNTAIPSLTGKAFDTVLGSGDRAGKLTTIVIALLVIVILRGALDLLARF